MNGLYHGRQLSHPVTFTGFVDPMQCANIMPALGEVVLVSQDMRGRTLVIGLRDANQCSRASAIRMMLRPVISSTSQIGISMAMKGATIKTSHWTSAKENAWNCVIARGSNTDLLRLSVS